FRDMFGLSSVEKWGSYNTTIKKWIKGGGIDRFKSPVFFKPVNDGQNFKVYILFEPIPSSYLDSTIEVIKGTETIPLRPYPLDFNEFFRFVADKTNYNVEQLTTLYEQYEKTIKILNEFKIELNYSNILKSIYEQLQTKQK